MWSLRYSRCLKLPPPQFCSAVNPNKTNRGYVGFCSIVCLLMAIKFLNDDKHHSFKWLRAKKNTKEIANTVKTLLRTARLDSYEQMKDDPFSLQEFFYLFHDLNRLGFFFKYNFIVIDYFTNEAIVRKKKQSLCLHRETHVRNS